MAIHIGVSALWVAIAKWVHPIACHALAYAQRSGYRRNILRPGLNTETVHAFADGFTAVFDAINGSGLSVCPRSGDSASPNLAQRSVVPELNHDR